MVKTEFDINNFCIDDVLDYVKHRKKVTKKEIKKKKKETDKLGLNSLLRK